MKVTFEQVDSVEKEEATIRAIELNKDIQTAIDLLEGGIGKISATKDGKTFLIKHGAIYYAESVDKRTYVYTKDDCYETKERLYELEESLGIFCARVSKSMVVNLKKVQNVTSEFGGRMVATMLNGEELVVSRSYVKDIKRRLGL